MRSEWDLTAPTFGDGQLYLAENNPKDDTERIYTLSASDGEMLFTYPVEHAFTIPTIASDTVFIGQENLLDAARRADANDRKTVQPRDL